MLAPCHILEECTLKFDLSSLLANFADMPPQKKKVLGIGGIAFIVLLFVSFLLSLTEGDNSNTANNQAQNQNSQQVTQGTIQTPHQPNSQIFDYTQGHNQQGGGLESLLNDSPNSNAQAQPQNQVNTSNPFAGFQNQQSTTPQNNPNNAAGPLPIPDANSATTESTSQPQQQPQQASGSTLFCDSFKTSGEAESQKAILAFQGISAAVVSNNDGSFRLKIGPLESADKARSLFNDLAQKGLVKRCSLINN